ncbi:MAG: hypothetical protein D6767_04150, partial [Candidatus Hydrogenedentota bacterium]
MRNKIILIAVSIIFLFTAQSFSQSNQQTKEKQTKGNKLKYTVAGLKKDDRFKVGNFSFSRRYANDGTGEYLEVFFDMKNYTDEAIPLEVVVIGVWEEDRVDEKRRKMIPYPKWRTRDFDKEVFDIKYADSIPPIDKTKINPNLKKREYPQMMDYVNYISKTPNIGIKFTLPGLEKAKIVSIIGDNYEIHGKNLEAMFVGRLYTKFSLKYY